MTIRIGLLDTLFIFALAELLCNARPRLHGRAELWGWPVAVTLIATLVQGARPRGPRQV